MIEIEMAKLAENSPVKVEVAGKDVCVVRQGDEVFAVEDLCSHAEASLSEGECSPGKIECWLHGAEFDLRTGEALTPPAIAPLKRYNVEISGEKVTITE